MITVSEALDYTAEVTFDDAAEVLSRLVSKRIRHELGHDPDHSGPEDTALEYAEQVIPIVLQWLDAVDPRDPKLSPAQVLCCEIAPIQALDR